MLEWAKGGGGVRFALIVHHTDAEREWAYDRNSSVGKLDKALDVAQAEGWTVVDMKNDWTEKKLWAPEASIMIGPKIMPYHGEVP